MIKGVMGNHKASKFSKSTRCSQNISALESNNHGLKVQLYLFQLLDFGKWLNFQWNNVLKHLIQQRLLLLLWLFFVCFWIPKGFNNALKMITFINVFWLSFISLIKLVHRASSHMNIWYYWTPEITHSVCIVLRGGKEVKDRECITNHIWVFSIYFN